MYDLAVKLNSVERLIETLHLLNYLLRNSPSNFHAKLLCLQIFHISGCALGAHKIYESLDIKHIQLDSMGYMHCTHLPLTGIISLAKPLYDQTLKFFTASYKDSLEYLAMSYKFGSFSKLQEFMDFRECLSNSLQYSLTSVEALIQEIVCFNGTPAQNLLQFQNMKIEPNEDRIKYDELTDNRDLDVMIRWDPLHQYSSPRGEALSEPISMEQKIKDSGKESFVQDTELLQLRSTLLRLVAASVDLIQVPHGTASSNNNNDTKDHNGHSSLSSIADKEEVYKMLKGSWSELYNRIRKMNYQQSSSEFLVNLMPSRLHFMLHLPYEDVISALSNFVYNIWIGSEKTKDSSARLVQAFDNVRSCIERLELVKIDGPLFEYRNLQATVVGCIEVSSLLSSTHTTFFNFQSLADSFFVLVCAVKLFGEV